MTDINKLAERLRELSELYIPARHDPESAPLLQTAANELERLERQPIRWRPISEAPKTAQTKDLLIWSDFHRIAILGGWSSFAEDWVDSDCCIIIDATHFVEIAGPEGESC